MAEHCIVAVCALCVPVSRPTPVAHMSNRTLQKIHAIVASSHTTQFVHSKTKASPAATLWCTTSKTVVMGLL